MIADKIEAHFVVQRALSSTHLDDGWDLTKNICEVFGAAGYIRTAYTYTPYGEVSTSGDVTQPVQWSSEYNDIESNLIYYNYRYYNAIDGRWIGKDLIGEKDHNNLHVALSNAPCYRFDVLGETSCSCTIILYVDPPSMNAVENDVLNVGIDTGHTWLEVHDGSEIITFSVGPNGKIGKRDLDDFEAGTYDGVTDWETETHAASAVKKDWELTPCQCQKAKKLIEEKQKKGIKYTPTYQCTTAALELLNAIPVTPAPPDGVGNVVAKKGVYTAWSGRVANPYHLSKQLGASVQTNSTSSQKDKKAQK